MAKEDPLSKLLDPKVMSAGLPALLCVPDPAVNTVSVDNVEKATAQLFGLLGAVVNRHA
jgi:hypothetical protein